MAESEGTSEVRIPGSFETLYQSDYAAVVGLVYAMTGSRWVAEDLAQEAFLRAHRDWERVENMESPGGWVRRVALNLSRSRWRRLNSEAKARLVLDRHEEAAPEIEPDVEGFWDEVRRLPTRQGQVIALYYVEDLSLAETGSILGIAEGTVKALLHQGRERLRRQLIAKGLVDELR